MQGKAMDLQPFSAAPKHHLVRRVDDGIHRKCRNVALRDYNASSFVKA